MTATILAAIPAVISGVCLAVISRIIRRSDCSTERRRRENMLILRGLYAIGGLAHATASALKDGHCNGNVTDAVEEYTTYKDDLKQFLIEQNAERNH